MKTAATRGQILWLKCTKIDLGWGSTQDPTGGPYSSTPPDPLAGFMGVTSKGREGREGEGQVREGKGKGKREGKGGKGRGWGREKNPTFKMSVRAQFHM